VGMDSLYSIVSSISITVLLFWLEIMLVR